MADSSASGVDPTLYLYTSLTAGSSHIITATSRMETILKANKVAFRAIDCATDEKARQLWSRKSKNRKLPGLVKYGQVVADINEVEEWNEYGELQDNLDNVSDLFGDTPMTDTILPPPAPITVKDPLARPFKEPVPGESRPTSQRHISISDPKDKENSSARSSVASGAANDTPLSIAMKQASAEAAAKGAQRKASAITSPRSSGSSLLPANNDPSEITPTPVITKATADAEEPSDDPSVTEAKMPALLAAEGAQRSSVDKIEDNSSTDETSSVSSTEEQILQQKRDSSIVQAPSRLANEVSTTDLPDLEKEDSKTERLEEEAVTDTPVATSQNVQPGQSASARPKTHRGSSLSQASEDEIKRIEQKNAIHEESGEDESEEEEEDDEESSGEDAQQKSKPATKAVSATDREEAKVLKGTNPQDHSAKDAEKAGLSVGD